MSFDRSFTPGLSFRPWVVTPDAALGDWLSAHRISFEPASSSSLADGLELNPKDLKRFDRQSLLLMRLLRLAGVRDWSAEDRERIPVQTAVGPAQTDRDALVRWGRRVEPSEPLPMVQPAQAVSLLPNTPLSLVSIAFGLRGEGAVWAGFAEAGCRALLSGMTSILDGRTDQALVLGVSSPDNYFVKQVWQRGFHSLQQPPCEVAVAILLGASDAPGRLCRVSQTAPEAFAPMAVHDSSSRLISRLSPDVSEVLPEGLTTTPLLGLASLAADPQGGQLSVPVADGHRWQFSTEARV